MAHPFNEHRANKVEHSRVGHITKGYASGGAVHGDEAEDRAMIKGMVKPGSLKVHGDEVKHRADKPHRARGGRLKGGRGKGTHVNVIVAPHPGGAGAGPAGPGMSPPIPQPVPEPVPARPPMPAPAMAGPSGVPPGGAPGLPPGMPPGIRSHGGRAYAKGGGVKSGPGWEESERTKTQVQHAPGKDDGKDLGRGKPVTYKRGGAVEASAKMGPKMEGGAGGGLGRLEKQARARRDYAKA